MRLVPISKINRALRSGMPCHNLLGSDGPRRVRRKIPTIEIRSFAGRDIDFDGAICAGSTTSG